LAQGHFVPCRRQPEAPSTDVGLDVRGRRLRGRLAVDVLAKVPVERKPMMDALMLETEMPRMRALRPVSAQATAELAEPMISMSCHAISFLPVSGDSSDGSGPI
jgi:hypothetical protein